MSFILFGTGRFDHTMICVECESIQECVSLAITSAIELVDCEIRSVATQRIESKNLAIGVANEIRRLAFEELDSLKKEESPIAIEAYTGRLAKLFKRTNRYSIIGLLYHYTEIYPESNRIKKMYLLALDNHSG